MSQPVTLTYTNWRGETAERTITPTGRVLFTSNEWHPEPQWLVEASGVGFAETRLFALAGFGAPPSKAGSYDRSFFVLDEDGTGTPWEFFVTAVSVWTLMHPRQPVTIRMVAATFDVTDATVREAVEEHPWMFVSGPDDDPTKQIIEHDGE